MLDLEAKLMISPTIAPHLAGLKKGLSFLKKNFGGLTNWYNYLKNGFINVINFFVVVENLG